MFYRFSALIVTLAVCAGSLMADDKDKKEAKSIKGAVSKFDKDKHSVTLKTDDGEKDYQLAEEVLIVFGTGQKVTASQKPAAAPAGQRARPQGPPVLAVVLRNGNKVELVLAEKENTVKEIHWDNRSSTSPKGKPAGAPVGTKKNVPDDVPKKDGGKN
jgi:predicted RNA-binding protein